MAMVSLSTSNESSTATRAPFGHAFGCSDRPARTALTTVLTLSMVHCQPGFAFVCGTGCAWASSEAGNSRKMMGRMGHLLRAKMFSRSCRVEREGQDQLAWRRPKEAYS